MTMASQLAVVPADRVVQLQGASVGAIALALAAEGTGPAAVVGRADGRSMTPSEFVGSALDDLERVAVELVPAWLPEVVSIDRPDVGGVAAIRMIATARARQAHYQPSLLVELALRAMTGFPGSGPDLPIRMRAAQLARLVAEGFGRSRTVLLVEPATELTLRDRDAIVAGAGWLAHAKLPVWLVGPLPVSEDQVPLVRLEAAELRRTAPIGRPHPASTVERALEAALAAQSWAGGRRWNQPYRSDPLSPLVRLDLLWAEERCVVELDGPEHCLPDHFEADRQRDVQLQLDGYAVLRFTNARVIHDVGAVVHQIGTYLRGRRRDLMEGRTPWPAKTSPPPRTRS
jgi:very-short-patch-repair endonuclease